MIIYYKLNDRNINRFIPQELKKIISSECVLGGGALRCKFDNTELQDYDIFPISFFEIIKTCKHLINLGFERTWTCKEHKLVTFEKFGKKYQVICPQNTHPIFDMNNNLITNKMSDTLSDILADIMSDTLLNVHQTFFTIESLIESFDFTACKMATDGQTLYVHENAINHARNKFISFTDNIPFPIATMKRIEKYAIKGYRGNGEAYETLFQYIVDNPDANPQFYID